MKPVSVFLYFAGLYILLFFLDWLKATVFLTHYHNLILQLKTLALVLGGVAIMWYTLPRNVFTKFIIVYSILWVIYIILKIAIHKTESYSEGTTNNILSYYLYYTQLISPLPFILYWLVARVYQANEEE